MSAQKNPKAKKPLLLVDLNGTLGHRCEDRLRGAKEDLFVRRKYYYLRPDIIPFLKEMSLHYDVAIYTSIQIQNVRAVMDAMDRNYRCYITKLYDQSFCKKDPQGINEWDTIRDMNKVWAHSGNDITNTILLDNETRKFAEVPDNGIVVPEYGPQQARSKKRGTLSKLNNYLIELATVTSTLNTDVRDFMKEFPYHTWKNINQSSPLLVKDMAAISLSDSLCVPSPSLVIKDTLGMGMLLTKVAGGQIHYQEYAQASRLEIRIPIEKLPADSEYHREMQCARILEMADGSAIVHVRKDGMSVTPEVDPMQYDMIDVTAFLCEKYAMARTTLSLTRDANRSKAGSLCETYDSIIVNGVSKSRRTITIVTDYILYQVDISRAGSFYLDASAFKKFEGLLDYGDTKLCWWDHLLASILRKHKLTQDIIRLIIDGESMDLDDILDQGYNDEYKESLKERPSVLGVGPAYSVDHKFFIEMNSDRLFKK